MTGFFAVLEERARAAGSLLCVGIDPRARSASEARDISLRLIGQTAHAAAAFKPNSAFFEALGPDGIEALIEVVAAIPDEIPVILDAKRGDISSTAAAYATACFDVIGAGAVTLNPYLGRDAIDPFLDHAGRGVWVLSRTSNPSAATFQDAPFRGDACLADAVAIEAASWAGPDRLGLVVGATAPGALQSVRAAVPEHWILAPGVGAQGGDPNATGAALRDDGLGVLVPVSRSVADATDPGAAAADLRDALARLKPPPRRRPGLAGELHRTGCIRIGEFELRSGVTSPLYVDLRRLTASPTLLRHAAAAIAALTADVPFDLLAAVPYGALPLATAVALQAGMPLIWPRKETKAHGTGAHIEGEWAPGQRALLVDDVATSGGSVLEAAASLRSAGLEVTDAVVLVERTPQARFALAEADIQLHTVTTLEAIVADLLAADVLTDDERRAAAGMAGT